MKKLNLNAFQDAKLEKRVTNNLFGGKKPVQTTGGESTVNGCTVTTTDGWNDDNNDGIQQCDETQYISTTITCPCDDAA